MPQFQQGLQLEVDRFAWEKAQDTWERAYQESLLTGNYQGRPTTQWLMDQARLTPDSAQRAQLFLEAARMMDDAQLFIPVAAPIRWSLVSGRAPGFEENPFARHTLMGLANMGSGGGLR